MSLKTAMRDAADVRGYILNIPDWCRHLYRSETPVDGKTIMSTESVWQVARSWVDVGSFQKRLFGIVYFAITSVREFLYTPSYNVKTIRRFRGAIFTMETQQGVLFIFAPYMMLQTIRSIPLSTFSVLNEI
jgi:hypothetical protein